MTQAPAAFLKKIDKDPINSAIRKNLHKGTVINDGSQAAKSSARAYRVFARIRSEKGSLEEKEHWGDTFSSILALFLGRF